MLKKTFIIYLTVAGLCLATPLASVASLPIPDEPSDDCLVEQSYDTSVGLFFRSYSLHGDGQVDYRTARHIVGISYDDPATESLEVSPHPVLYWYDPHRDGRWQTWVDRDEQGTPANATPYDWNPGDGPVGIIKEM